jgi:glycerol kinase
MDGAARPPCSGPAREGSRSLTSAITGSCEPGRAAATVPFVAVVVAIDAGTSGVRALAVDETCRVVDSSYRELPQHFPAPGRVEHDAGEIWALVQTTLTELCNKLDAHGLTTSAIGIANQRETAVAWDRSTGHPSHRAIVWQDRRTAQRCQELTESGHLALIRERTGLVLDPYFSGTKWSWMLEHGGVEVGGSLALGTVDDWVCWNLTGGAGKGAHVTDPSNARCTRQRADTGPSYPRWPEAGSAGCR